MIDSWNKYFDIQLIILISKLDFEQTNEHTEVHSYINLPRHLSNFCILLIVTGIEFEICLSYDNVWRVHPVCDCVVPPSRCAPSSPVAHLYLWVWVTPPGSLELYSSAGVSTTYSIGSPHLILTFQIVYWFASGGTDLRLHLWDVYLGICYRWIVLNSAP